MRMSVRALRASAAALGVAAILAGTVAAPASADPAFVPDATDIVGTGSDTTQDVMGALASRYNNRTPKPADRLASFDAVGSATITPAAGCAAVARPNGSSAGISALRADTAGCLEFARSSRGPRSGEEDLRFIPFALDAVSWNRAATSNAPASLSRQELSDIYTCTTRNWNQVGGTAGTIVPILPNTNSGTRSFFLQAISANPDVPVTPGACVVNGVRPRGGAVIQENDARELNLALPAGASAANAILPYSVAKYVFQGKGSTIKVQRGTSRIGDIDPLTGSDQADPVTGTRTSGSNNTERLNSAFTSQFRRNVFNVVEEVNGLVPAKFNPLFGRGGFICGATGDSVVTAQGFGVLPQAQCGYVAGS